MALPTLLDLMKSLDPNGQAAQVCEQLAKLTPFVEDAPVKEGNLQTGHQVTLRTGLPSGTWRRFNQGVVPTKSQRGQLTETCAMLEAYSKVDCGLAELNGGASFRADEDVAHAMGLGQDAEEAIVHANSETDPEQPHGLAARLDSIVGNPYGTNVISHTAVPAGNDNTSMYLVGWGDRTAYLIYPKGTKGGLTSEDLGKRLTQDADGNEFTAWVTHWKWMMGLAVEDWRSVVRICNIDVSQLSITNFDLVTKSVTALHKVPEYLRRTTKMRWYCNRTVAEYLHQQALNKVVGAGPLYVKEIGGQEVTMLHGFPVRTAETILNTESEVT